MERQKNWERQKPKDIQKVVRSLVVSLASHEEIYRGFLGNQEEQPSILRFYLAVKGDDENSRYTLLGGKINPWEDFSEAIQREVNEEAGLNFLGFSETTIIGQWSYSSSKSGEREVILTYNPILPPTKMIIGDPKIKDLEILTLKELEQLVREGHLNGIPLENHLAIGNSIYDPIEISEEDSKLRETSMSKALLWMKHIENYLRAKFRQIIFKDGSPISEELFQAEYEKILSRFMRRSVEDAIKRKVESQKEKGSMLIEVLNSGYLGKDILYFLPKLAKYGVNWYGLEEAPEGVKIFVNFLKQTFTDFINQQGLTEEDYRQLMENDQILLDEKVAQLNALNKIITNRLKEIFNLTDNDLQDAMEHVQNFFRDLSNEIRVADPNLTEGLYQDFTLSNEVNNANFGSLLNLFLGFDTKKNSSKIGEVTRFEAGRQLLLLFKSLSGIKYYKEKIKMIREGKIQYALSNFFGPALEERIIQLDKFNKMRVIIRKRGNQFFIVDEKPIKTFTSFLRKIFEEKIEDVFDFFSVSVVFMNENQNPNKVDLFNEVDLLIEEFRQFLLSQFPESQVFTFDRKNYGTKNYLLSKETVIDGKRRGSQGNKLVRTKLFFQLDDEKLELAVYPLYSTGNLSDRFWGWLEKIRDDKNYIVRRLFASEKGFPSLYDLLFPPELYPYHYLDELKSFYHNSF